MEGCLGLPGEGPLSFLCLWSGSGQGEEDSYVEVKSLAFGNVDTLISGKPVIDAQDERGTFSAEEVGGQSCLSALEEVKPILLSIDNLIRSSRPGEFAYSDITYVTPRDVADTCKKDGFAKVKVTHGTIRYMLEGNQIRAISHLEFANKKN